MPRCAVICASIAASRWHTVVRDRQHCASYTPAIHSHVALSSAAWTNPKLETALLKDVDDTYYFGANCSSCLHASRLSLTKLRAHLGDDYPVARIRIRLMCELCGSKAVTITYLTPSQCTGSLVHLFDKKTKG
jgi:hypothetical protein